jgi:hypothetical protein
MILRGRWFHIIVLNQTENKIYDVKGSFYEEYEHVFDKFCKNYMKILLVDFSAKVGKEDILNQLLEMKVHTKLVETMELE